MANIKFTNFARSKLTVGISAGATTITITGASGALFPALTAGQYFYATLESAALAREIVKVTARTGDSLTVTRAQDNTTALTWNAGDTLALRFNAAAIADTLADLSAGNYSGNLTFTGTGNRITGDFSNATVANRVMFQSSTVNGSTLVSAIPNGTATAAYSQAYNSSAPDNAAWIGIGINTADARLMSDRAGTGTYLPMTFFTGGLERMRIDTSGVVQVAAAAAAAYSDGTYGTPRMQWNAKTGLFSGAVSIADATTLLSHLLLKNPNGVIASFATSGNDTVIANAGNFVVSGAAGGLGYGTGAGGTVTQATSKTTAVTLNKPSGQITMNGAALATGAWVTFTLNNSLVSATDAVVASIFSDSVSSFLYSVIALPKAGAIIFSIKQDSGASQSDLVKINFELFKGATS